MEFCPASHSIPTWAVQQRMDRMYFSAAQAHTSYAKLCYLDRPIDRLPYNGKFSVALSCCASAFWGLVGYT